MSHPLQQLMPNALARDHFAHADNGFQALARFAAAIGAAPAPSPAEWRTGATLAAETAEDVAAYAENVMSSSVRATWLEAAARLRATAADYQQRAAAAETRNAGHAA